ncbi:MAG: phenylalanine--tRNA ligase subunit beta, partial [Deltaproteobacteria bacterium]|nr:phenylalanine--tRNA ligase subunit beta [Deltaproteobacteria bacterium]
MALRVSYSWLKDYLELTLTPEALAERLTVAGMEVESVTRIGGDWDPQALVVGHVTRVAPHPDAERLCLVTVEHGGTAPLTVVTGAPNLFAYLTAPLPAAGLKVPFAQVGAVVIDGHHEDGRTLKLKAGKIRGVVSEGMVCSEKELGLSESHEGIMVLPDDAPVGAALRDYLGDHVLEFDIKGGFAHLMCVFGIAREASALTGTPLKRTLLEHGAKAPSAPETSFIRLEIEDPVLCPRYTAILIENITVASSPFWMQQRLLRAGMRPINAVVDATNYVMLELGQPLHAFDYHSLRGEKGAKKPLIRVRRATPGEQMKTLDNVERTFDKDMQLITDGGGAVAVAGVMGGLDSEISQGTTHVLLETANFEFLNTRRTAQLLKLRSEAGERFGKRLDPELCLTAGLRCAHLIAELCGGTVRAEYGDLYPAPRAIPPIALPLEFIQRLLGMEIPKAEVVRILTALEFKVTDGVTGMLQVTPPSHRPDATLPADLVEEVARIYGYDRMPATRMADELPPQRRNRRLDGAERVRDLLVGCGLDEIISYSIIALEDEARLNPNGNPPEAGGYLQVRNPLSAERAHLRRRLLPEGLNTTRANLRFGSRVAIFEVGAVFHPVAGQTLPNENRRLCVVLTGPRASEGWQSGGAERDRFDFFDIKGVCEALLEGMEVGGLVWEPGAGAAYHPGRSAKVKSGDLDLGVLGELHPGVVQSFGLPPQPVCAMELDLDTLVGLWRQDKRMTGLSTHPPVYEDLAFVVG